VKHGIDPGVYTKNRPFRFLGCHKIGSDRTLAVEGAGEAGTPSHWRLFLSTMICEPPTADTTPIERPPPAKRTAKKRGGPFTDRTGEPKSRRVGGAPSAPITSAAIVTAISTFISELVQQKEDAYVSGTKVRDDGAIALTYRRNAFLKPCRFGGTHTSNHFKIIVYPASGKILYTCFGSLGHHPPHSDGRPAEKGDVMTLPESLPPNLRTTDPSSELEMAMVRELVDQAQQGDLGFAALYVKYFGHQNLKLTSTAGAGYMWDAETLLWRETPSNLIINSIQRVLMALMTSSERVLARRIECPDGDGANLKQSLKVITRARRTIWRQCNLKGALQQLCDLLYDPHFLEKINAEPFQLPLKGGDVIDLHTLAVRPRSQTDLWSWESNASYLGPDARCAVALDVLRQVADIDAHPERQGYPECLQAMLGSLLCADRGAKTLVQLHGTSGNNMKSELVNLLKACVRSTFTSIDDSILTSSKPSTGGPDPLMAQLQGKRVAVMADTGNSLALNNVANVKRITGGDEFANRKCHENGGDMHCVCKPVVCTNHPIAFDVTDSAMVERVGNHYYPFTRQFVKSKAGNTKCEAYKTTHLNQFFTTFIRGAHMYARAGEAATCGWLDKARAEYMKAINPVGSFLDDDCVRDLGAKWGPPVTGAAAYSTTLYGTRDDDGCLRGYIGWCSANGVTPMSQKVFGEKMTVIFGKAKPTKLRKGDRKARAYLGVRLKTAAEKADAMDCDD